MCSSDLFEEHSTYSSARFLEHLIQLFPKPIECVQTDNGMEFTKRFSTSGKEALTLFQRVLKEHGIRHKLIRPFTPRHNGKVERSHRNDQRYFYDWEHFRTIEQANAKLEEYLTWSNSKPMRTLGHKSPIELLEEKLYGIVTYTL